VKIKGGGVDLQPYQNFSPIFDLHPQKTSPYFSLGASCAH